MLNIGGENEQRTEIFVILKTYPSFLKLFQYDQLPFVQKKSSSGRKRIFLFVESVQISPSSFVCEREES